MRERRKGVGERRGRLGERRKNKISLLLKNDLIFQEKISKGDVLF